MGKNEIAKINNSAQIDTLPKLKPKERKLVQLILETGFTKPKQWYADQIGVSRIQIHKYLAKPGVMDAVFKLLDKTLWELRPLAYEKLKEAVLDGNMVAIKLVFQLRGELVEHKDVNIKKLVLAGTFDPTQYLQLIADIKKMEDNNRIEIRELESEDEE